MRLGLWFTLLCAAACGAPEPTYRENTPTGWSVVLVTFDGVRWQELFEGADPVLTRDGAPVFERFWSELAPRGRVYGDPRRGEELRVATASNASLPGYMSIYGETAQGCLTNLCGKIGVPTFVDRLHDELALPPAEVEVLSSWAKLPLAVTSRDDVASMRLPGAELPPGTAVDEAFEFDRGTSVAALEAVGARQPRFLHLAFLDSDRYAHQGDYARYLGVLRAYDRLLVELSRRLDANTALVVTTDHGRGVWDQWSEHGPQVPASARVWAYVKLPEAATGLTLVEPRARRFDHHDVRYTIETLFGLSTTSTSGFSTGFVASP